MIARRLEGSESGQSGPSQKWFVDPALCQVARSVSEHVLELVGLRYQQADVLK